MAPEYDGAVLRMGERGGDRFCVLLRWLCFHFEGAGWAAFLIDRVSRLFPLCGSILRISHNYT